MHYGFLQGEIGAAGRIGAGSSGSTSLFATLIGEQFNIVSASLASEGVYAVRLKDGIPAAKAAILVTACDLITELVHIGPQTPNVKVITVGSLAGAPVSGQFYLVILRTS